MPPESDLSMVASVGSVSQGEVVAEDGAAIGAVVPEGEVRQLGAAAGQVAAPHAATLTQQDPAAFMTAMQTQMMAKFAEILC